MQRGAATTGPVDCELTAWGPWGACDKGCDGGTQTRKRSVKTPAQNDGKECEGDLKERKECNTQECTLAAAAKSVYRLQPFHGLLGLSTAVASATNARTEVRRRTRRPVPRGVRLPIRRPVRPAALPLAHRSAHASVSHRSSVVVFVDSMTFRGMATVSLVFPPR